MAIIIFLKNWRDTGLFISVLQLQGNIINSNLAYLERGGGGIFASKQVVIPTYQGEQDIA